MILQIFSFIILALSFEVKKAFQFDKYSSSIFPLKNLAPARHDGGASL